MGDILKHMFNKGFERGPHNLIEHKRREFISSFLRESVLDGHNQDFGEGDFVTTLEGPYAAIGMKVVWVGDDGTVHLRPSPDTQEIVECQAKDLFAVDEYRAAFLLALQLFPDPQSNPGKIMFVEVAPQLDDGDSYENIKTDIISDATSVSSKRLESFLKNLHQDDYRIAAVAYRELKDRESKVNND